MPWEPSKAAAAYGTHGRETLNGEPAGGVLPPGILRELKRRLKAQWKRYCRELKRCQKNFSETAVHDSRVETRRLLSLLTLLEPFLKARKVKKAEAALKRHLDTFDELRDTQVQLLAVEKLLRRFPEACGFHRWLRKREARFAAATRKHIKHIKPRRLGELIGTFRESVAEQCRQREAPTTPTRLLRSVDRAFARTEALRCRIKPDDTRTIHCTRVAFKRFRYMVELLAGYLPGTGKAFLAALHRYQTLMGHIQDMEVLLQTLECYLGKKKARTGPMGPFRQALLRRREELINQYLARAGQLQGFWPLNGKAKGARRAGKGRARAAQMKGSH